MKHPLKKPAIRNIAHPDATHSDGKPLYRRNVADLPEDAILEGEEVADWLRVKPAWVRAHAIGNRGRWLPSITRWQIPLQKDLLTIAGIRVRYECGRRND
jgi:hypothetical protein